MAPDFTERGKDGSKAIRNKFLLHLLITFNTTEEGDEDEEEEVRKFHLQQQITKSFQ